MDKKIWENQYPKMPELFHLAVEQAVNRAVGNETVYTGQGTVERERSDQNIRGAASLNKRKKWRLLILAAVLCGGLISAAAVSGRKPVRTAEVDFQEKLGLGERSDLEEVWFGDVEVSIAEEPRYVNELHPEILEDMKDLKTDGPLITIDRIMYDGLQLAVCAYPTEEIEGYTIESWSMIVNGQKTGPNEMDDNMGKQDYFIFTAQLYDMEPADQMEVVLPLSVYRDNERYENQELLFTVEGKAAEQIPDQEFDLESCTVKLTEMRRTLTAFAGRIQIERTPEQQSSYEKEDREIIHMVLEGADGTRWEELPLNENTKTLRTDENHEEGYFYYEIPEDGQTQVNLQLMSRLKSERWEKWDSSDPANRYGEVLTVDLR